MESLVKTFHIDWQIVIAQFINFLLVFTVIYFFALKPLQKIMGERTEKIDRGVADAKENAILVEKTKKEYTNILNKAKSDAGDLIEKSRQEAETQKKEILNTTKSEVAQMIMVGKKALESEKVKVVEEAKKEIVELAIKTTEKMMATRDDISDYKNV